MEIWIPVVVAAVTLIGTVATAVVGSGRTRPDIEVLKELDLVRQQLKGTPIERDLLEAEKQVLMKLTEQFRRRGAWESVLTVVVVAGGAVALLISVFGLVAGFQGRAQDAINWTATAALLGGVSIVAGVVALIIRYVSIRRHSSATAPGS